MTDLAAIKAAVVDVRSQHAPNEWDVCVLCRKTWPCPAELLAEHVAAIVDALEREHRTNLPAHFLIAADHPARLECPTCALLADTPSVEPGGLVALQSVLYQIVSNGPLIDTLDSEAWGPADPRGVRLSRAIYEAIRAVDDYLAALPTQASDSPEKP